MTVKGRRIWAKPGNLSMLQLRVWYGSIWHEGSRCCHPLDDLVGISSTAWTSGKTMRCMPYVTPMWSDSTRSYQLAFFSPFVCKNLWPSPPALGSRVWCCLHAQVCPCDKLLVLHRKSFVNIEGHCSALCRGVEVRKTVTGVELCPLWANLEQWVGCVYTCEIQNAEKSNPVLHLAFKDKVLWLH